MDEPSAKPHKPCAPEIRVDPIKGHQVILAPDRLNRPGAIQLRPWSDQGPADCPFCPHNEELVPEAVLQHPTSGTPRVKVVPNKFPIRTEVVPTTMVNAALGRHEVVIESDKHIRSWSQLTISELTDVLMVVQRRLAQWKCGGRVRYAVFFKNCGPLAGASLTHVHSQIVGLPSVPASVERQLAAAEKHFALEHRCFLCDRMENDLDFPLILESNYFRVFCPEASRFAYESWVAPRAHLSHFELASADEIVDLASVLHAHLARLEQVLPNVCYNLALQSAPFDTNPNDHYHWHVEVYPRIANLAGYELITGQFVNAVTAGTAAESLMPAK